MRQSSYAKRNYIYIYIYGFKLVPRAEDFESIGLTITFRRSDSPYDHMNTHFIVR